MVGKLFKHEFSSYLRLWIPVEAIVLGMGILTRLIQFFETDSAPYNIVRTSAIVIFIISIVASLILSAIVLPITRFYKNMFTNEGYLTFTLPVKTREHIFTKLSVAFLSALASIFVSLIAAFIAIPFDVFSEVIKAALYYFNLVVKDVGALNITFNIIECAFIVFSLIIYGIMLFYACISIGQLSKKNKPLASFGCFFGYYVITQIVGTVFIIVTTLCANSEWVQNLLDWISENATSFFHILLCGIIVFYLVLSAVFYIISNKIIKKKLNLE